MENPIILIAEDEPSLAETLQYSLSRLNYQVFIASDGVSALEQARKLKPDLIVLDLMLPKLDGFEVCRILRQEMHMPIMMLTARTDEVDKIVGLEVGADDYMTKPFSMRELVARVKALLRRVRLVHQDISNQTKTNEPVGTTNERLIFDDLIIDPIRHEVLLNNLVVHLKPKEYDLLLFFARNRGIVLRRDLILQRVWGWAFDGGSRTVDVHIRWLREKIEKDSANHSRIVTVRNIGYRFEG